MAGAWGNSVDGVDNVDNVDAVDNVDTINLETRYGGEFLEEFGADFPPARGLDPVRSLG